jgi:hypothetical protein
MQPKDWIFATMIAASLALWGLVVCPILMAIGDIPPSHFNWLVPALIAIGSVMGWIACRTCPL